jgi:hypothetical protein
MTISEYSKICFCAVLTALTIAICGSLLGIFYEYFKSVVGG